MQNVAAYAGVSIATVSKVMQGDPTVRPENVVAVQNAIEALGYRINPLAAELRRGRRKLIGVVVAGFDAITIAIVRSLEQHLDTKGYAIWVECSDGSDERESMLISRLQNWRVAGFILMRAPGRSEGPELLLDNAAVVVIDSLEPSGAEFDSVLANPDPATRDLSERLRRTGHRNPVLLVSCSAGRRSEQLWVSLNTALQEVSELNPSSLHLEADALNAARQFKARLEGADTPTAIIALDHSFELLVASYVASRGLEIPGDLLLVRVRPAGAERSQQPGATTLEYPAQEVARKAVDSLLQRIEQPRTLRAVFQALYGLRD